MTAPVAIAIVSVDFNLRTAVAEQLCENLSVHRLMTRKPEQALVEGPLTKMSLGDLSLATDAGENMRYEAMYRSEPQSFVTAEPTVLSLAYCGDLYERLAQSGDNSVLALTSLLRIRSTIQHMAVMASQFEYSGIYFLPLGEDAREDLKRIEGHVKLALQGTHDGQYVTLKGDASEIAEEIASRVNEAAEEVQQEQEATDTVSAMLGNEDEPDTVEGPTEEEADEVPDGRGDGEAGEQPAVHEV